MIVLDVVHVVSMVIGKNLIRNIIQKRSSTCIDCGDDTLILIQVNFGPEIILLCSVCYNLKYLKEI